MKVIGITGGVGSGKTTLLNAIKEKYNCDIILADLIAKKLEQPGMICYEKLVDLLGERILNENGFIDVKLMSQAIFADKDILEEVNNIVHPAVNEYIIDYIKKAKASGEYDFLFVEAAILTEGGYTDYLDEFWYVYASKDVRIDRLSSGRGYSYEKSKSIIDKQSTDEEYLKRTQFVIDNSGDINNSLKQVAERLL